MDRSFLPGDWQPQATVGKRSQVGMPFLSVVPEFQAVSVQLLSQVTFNGCLVEAARHSGLEDQEIADQIHICHGYMSRFMRGVAQQWANRLIAFMRVTRSLAPLQWMAHQMGCDLVPRDSRAAEIAELQQRLRELGGAAA